MVHVRNINLPDYEEEGDPVSLTIEAPSEPPPPKPAPTPSESTLATWLRLQALHAAAAKPKKASRRSPPPPAQAAPIQIELF